MGSEANNRRNSPSPSVFPAGSKAHHGGFTLVELLLVIALMVLLISLSGMGIGQILQSSRMDQGGRLIVDEFNLARQIAASRNLNVEVRFIEKKRDGSAGDAPVFHAVQSGLIGKDGMFTALGAVTVFPVGIQFASTPEFSSMIGSLAAHTHTGPDYQYTAVVIRPTGAIEPQTGIALNEPWFVTIIREHDNGKTIGDIADFITVQVDPWTSRPTFYRP